MSWSVTGLSAGEIAAIRNITITYKHLEADEAVFDLALDYDGALTTGAVQVTVRWLTTVIFRGFIQRIRRKGSGREESCSIVALGPWSEWERTQPGINAFAVELAANWATNKLYPWYEFNGTNTTSILLQDLAGKVPSIAVAGTISLPSFAPPYKLLKNVTVAQCIRDVMRYHPNAVAFFDYSQNPPRFRVADRSVSVLNYNIPASAIDEYEVETRNDQILAGVVINYDRVVDVTDFTDGRKTSANSAASTDSTPGALLGVTNHLWYQQDIGNVTFTKGRVLASSMRLSALQRTYGTTTSAEKSGWIEFWNAFGVAVGSTSIANNAGVVTLKAYLSENDGGAIAIGSWVWLRQPIIPEFMYNARNNLGFVVAEFTITQTIEGVVRTTSFLAYRKPGAAPDLGDFVHQVYVPSPLQAAPPSGAAARLLADRNAPASQGTVKLVFDEVDLACLGRNRWTLPAGTVLEPIRNVVLDLFSGRVTAEFGQADNLGIQDYIQLLGAGRPL